MLTITRSGRIADVIAQARDVPARVIPYAAAAALTQTAKSAQASIKAELPRVFSNPTRYTLNATRVEFATKDKLSARVAVKDETTNNGTRPEDFLLPSVEGGGRKVKRFERNLVYGGVLARGKWAIQGAGAKLDAYGNMKPGEMQRILTVLNSTFGGYANKSQSKRSKRNQKNAPYFAALTSVSIVGGELVKKKSHLKDGIYRREGRAIKPVLIFTSQAPKYRRRLDFAAIAEQTARDEFEQRFTAAAAAILAKRR